MEICLDDMGGRQRDHALAHCAAQQHIDERRPSQRLARIHGGPKRLETLRDMRLDALRMMRLLVRFRPRLIGSVRTGHVRKGSDIDLHIFCDSLSLVTDTLYERGLQYDVEHKRIVKYGEERTFTHIHLNDGHKFELTLYPEDKVHYVFKISIKRLISSASWPITISSRKTRFRLMISRFRDRNEMKSLDVEIKVSVSLNRIEIESQCH